MSSPAGVVDDLLAGRYRLTSRLAAGGMGEVWRARDLLLDREVAVKTLRPELADDEDVRTRFRAEARHAARLSHPGIASVYDFGEAGGRAWLVLELVEGESLAAVLRRDGRLSADRTLSVVSQTAAALQVAHDAGVVHRDIKPGNLLIGPGGTVKVTDFGIASAAGAAGVTRTGQVVGTAAYLSPEQAGGRGATAATDLYALGVVAYECLAGRRPFDYEDAIAVLLAHLQTPPPALPDDVSGPLADLVLRLLAKDPADRPGPAREVAAEASALRRRLGDQPAAMPAVASPRTAVLPIPGPPAAAPPAATPPAATPPAATPPRVVRPARRQVAVPAPTGAAGLSGRAGQRRAVRATAVLLGLLAVALGVRESLSDPAVPEPGTSPAATSPAQSPVPTPSPVASAPAPAAPPAAQVEDETPAEPAQDARDADLEREQQELLQRQQAELRRQQEQVQEQQEDVQDSSDSDSGDDGKGGGDGNSGGGGDKGKDGNGGKGKGRD